jgi:hypothetical protein
LVEDNLEHGLLNHNVRDLVLPLLLREAGYSFKFDREMI